MKDLRKLLILCFSAGLLVQGCAVLPPPQRTHYPPRPVQEDLPQQPLPAIVEQPRRPESIATNFSHQAEEYRQQGNLDMAASTLERGLRLAPKDPLLWSQLAEIRLQQKNYQQARRLAEKSSSLAGSNSSIIYKNNWIIDKSRQ
ncbi:MAG: tetratricopeptide repeat protein [Desulforhopalus sp.]